MKCPECGNEDTKVIRTTKEPEGETIDRHRECKACGGRFHSFECYERADVEAPFQMADAHAEVVRAREWLRNPARHIPVVRDACKLLDRAAGMLLDPAISSKNHADTAK